MSPARGLPPLALVLVAALFIGADPSAGADAADAPTAPTFVGRQVCLGCHGVEAEHFAGTVHARAFASGARTPLESRDCEACHGPGSAHIAAPEDASRIVAFTRESGGSAERMNEMCLACHSSGPLLHWQGSTHEWQGLACSDCHNPMARTSSRALLRERTAAETCFGCHPAQRSEFRKRSHMPLFEGKIGCQDCHAPHGSPAGKLIKAASTNDLCYGCHAEKRGPFLWEHAPARESCLNCHRPHGSNHERLLVTARPFLCQQCHAQIDDAGFSHVGGLLSSGQLGTDERLLNQSCTNCHVKIHGSNHPSGARFHR